MYNVEPKVCPSAIFGVKETCAILGISRNTLLNKRKKGLIEPVNPQALKLYRYTGEAIMRLWRLENNLPI